MERVIGKVKDLLRLGQSDNVHEAAAAMAAAQRLMEVHRLDQAMLDVSDADAAESREPIEHGELASLGGASLPRWKWIVASALCRANGCKGYADTTWTDDWRAVKRLHIIGRASDAQTVRYLFQYVVAEIDRLTREASRARGRPGATWCNSFRLGAAMEISGRIGEATARVRDEARQAAATNEAQQSVATALARLERHEDAIEEYAQKVLHLQPGRRPARGLRVDVFAFDEGREAGRGIGLGSGRQLGSGGKPLPE